MWRKILKDKSNASLQRGIPQMLLSLIDFFNLFLMAGRLAIQEHTRPCLVSNVKKQQFLSLLWAPTDGSSRHGWRELPPFTVCMFFWQFQGLFVMKNEQINLKLLHFHCFVCCKFEVKAAIVNLQFFLFILQLLLQIFSNINKENEAINHTAP